MKMNALEKVRQLVQLLEANENRITNAQLLNATGTPRRARRALFVARKGGMILEPVRNRARTVTEYIRTNAVDYNDVEKALLSKRKRQPKSSVTTNVPDVSCNGEIVVTT